MINFTRPDEAGQLRKKLTRRVKGWVEEALPDQYADWLIMVNEMQCFEPVRGTALTLVASAQCPTEHL